MKRNKFLAVCASVAVATLALSACSSAAPDSSPSKGKEVTFWGTWSGDQQRQAQEMIDLYNGSQDVYHVTYQAQEIVEQKLLTAMAGGDVPDVVLWDRNQTALYAGKGVLHDLTDLVAKDSVDTSQFYEQAVLEMTHDDKLFGLPLTVDNRSIFYNKTLFEEAGLTPPTTWDELATTASALTVWDGSSLKQAGFSLDDAGLFNIWCYQAGCDLLSEDGTTTAFNSPAGLSVLTFWDQLLNQDKVYKLGFGDGTDPFAEGKLAMKYDGPWAISTYNKVEGLDYGVVEPPTGPNGDKGAGMGGFGLIIPEGAKNVDGAWDFMTWWSTQPENGVKFGEIAGWIPANVEAANNSFFVDDEHYGGLIATMEFAKVRPIVAGYSDVEGLALIPQLQKFLSGESSAETALSTAQSEGDALLSKAAAGR
ncbi:carbohydrate ABC transporter substrate-binding protein, CUT1 family [Sanguibacter gelidistatuariae]|uniref:Carbohydrate ABC transporter substrate-binding protein, CUT1 family n=1 Tax=Sanguibacter gelidistatuariae TaxID=1814289 RepID=A0A1G6KMH5_9MICO|nr:ABC transporter substrate-binding protein [Sanguibacter gelidistatuariae]SDC32250.1 carbohydrate ABC transporter substrate-binding protein, CUT1 family [Sanguibacter gelidistatuariae]